MTSERRGRRQSIGHKAPSAPEPQAPEELTLELIAQKLDRLTWRHSLWGVDEREAWHVIQRLDEMYRQLYQSNGFTTKRCSKRASGESRRRMEEPT